jgi:hypothetical protein
MEVQVIGVVMVDKAGTEIFSYEFPVAGEDAPIVGVTWAEGIKTALDYFRKSFEGYSLLDDDISLRFGSRL